MLKTTDLGRVPAVLEPMPAMLMYVGAASQPDEVVYRWTVDELSLSLSTECVFDHVFDTAGLYNVCVSVFNSGKPLSVYLPSISRLRNVCLFSSAYFLYHECSPSCLALAKQAAFLGFTF